MRMGDKKHWDPWSQEITQECLPNGTKTILGRALPLHTESQKSRWERVSNTGGSYIEECSWFALWWVRPDVSAGDREIYSLQRLSSSAVVWLSLKAIHPHTWIRNEIITPPLPALITQPWWLDGPSPIERVRIWIEKRRSWQAGTI